MPVFPARKEDCAGCGACRTACPSGAVRMAPDEEGFPYPVKDATRCDACGRCAAVCPVRRAPKNLRPPLQLFCGRSPDEPARARSSSGGVFPALAKYVLERGGLVYGAAMPEDGPGEVRHLGIKRIEDLPRLQGAKYVQSGLGDTLEEISGHPEKRPILFSGTPCQVAAVRALTGDRALRPLCLDVVCYGVASPVLFQKYLAELGEISDFRFREKGAAPGGRAVGYTRAGKRAVSPYGLNPYMAMFFKNLSLRPSCHACRFTRRERAGDITLADFHNPTTSFPGLDDGKGLSTILINSEWGKTVWEEAGRGFRLVSLTWEQALQARLLEPSPSAPERAAFFADLATCSFAELAARHAPPAASLRGKMRKIRELHAARQ